MSTPVENIVNIGYFEEIRDLIRKKPVNLAGLQQPLFGLDGSTVKRKRRAVLGI